MSYKWKCTVCGYIHEGETPPDICPVCGADKDKFIQLTENEATQKFGNSQQEIPLDARGSIPLFGTRFKGLFDLTVKHHVHPISSHMPNGVIPLSVLFLLLSAVFSVSSLSQAALFNMIVVLLTLPGVLCSGYIVWHLKYGGHLTGLFKAKIASALVTFILTLILTVWLLIDPGVVSSSGGAFLFIVLCLIWLGAVTMAGYLGGKLVFKD